MKLNDDQKKLASNLRPMQLKFANLHLLKNENKLSDANAYIEAGYKVASEKSAYASAARMLTNVKVKAYIDACKDLAAEETGLTLQYLDKKLKDMIETDISDLIDTVPMIIEVDGKEITVFRPVVKEDIKTIPKSALSSINSIKMTKEGIQYSLPDRKAILELAYKRKGGLLEKHEHTGKNGLPLAQPIADEIEKARKKMADHFKK